MKDNQEELKRQWMEALGPGWPCEAWDGDDDCKFLYYLSYFLDDGIPVFTAESFDVGEGGDYYKNYFPLSTPLDFLMPDAEKIKIGHDKFCIFENFTGSNISKYLYWPNCPEGMRGKTFEIPDDWRP